MAIYTLPAGVDQINRSRGAACFTQCGNTPSIRQRVRPINRRTAINSIRRNNFKATLSQYQTLSPSRITAYESRVSLWPRTNSLGTTYYMHPANLWAFKSIPGLNQQNLPDTFAPTPTTIPNWFCKNFAIALDTLSFNFESSTSYVPGGSTFRFWTTNWSRSPDLKPWPFGYRLTYTDSTNTTPYYNIFLDYVQTWGGFPNVALPTGEYYYIGFQFQILHISNSQRRETTNVLLPFSVH